MAQGMNKLNEALASLPEVRELLLSLDTGTSPIAVSGLSGVHRAQLAAAVRHKTQRPLLIVCADENEANRMAGDLHELLGEDVSLLFAREWQLRDRVFASHGWEQQRIGSLCSLAAGKAPILVATVDGLMQRTLPPDALRGAVTDISLGDRFDLNALSKKLVESGYTRAETVEGVGQFALRGGILDIWSPLSAPVRVEFFDDEVDAMGEFDVTTQRRTQNVKSLTVLPAAEVLPALSDGGREKMLERLGRAAQKIAKKAEDSPIVQTLRSDIERLRNDLPLGGMDRYLAACYPDEVCALDYLSPDTLIAVSDGMRVLERSKNYHWELSEDVKPLIEEGVLCGEFAALALSQEALSHRMGAFPVLLLDSLPTSRNLLPPRAILSMNARSLPSYGGSLETAAGDMERYLGAGCGVLVLCGNETRAKNFRRLLEERNIRAQLNLKNDRLPAPHETVIGLGALSAGSEYPQLKLVILTEGQLTAPLSGKRAKARPKKETSARAALRSYEDLSPGDLVVHVHHGIGRFVGMERMTVDGAERDFIKIAFAGTDFLYVPATSLDLISKYIGGGEPDKVRLNKPGGADWLRSKARAPAAVKELADGLLQGPEQLTAAPPAATGSAVSPASPWYAWAGAPGPTRPAGSSTGPARARSWVGPSPASTWAPCSRPATAPAPSMRSARSPASAPRPPSRPFPCCGPAASSRRATPSPPPAIPRPSWPVCSPAWVTPPASTTPGMTPPAVWPPPGSPSSGTPVAARAPWRAWSASRSAPPSCVAPPRTARAASASSWPTPTSSRSSPPWPGRSRGRA